MAERTGSGSELCRLSDVRMAFGRHEVLHGVDLGIPRGAIMGLVGDNGSGKSTLLKILAGIIKPDSGRLLSGSDGPEIGYMPENCQWYPHMTGWSVLRYFSRIRGAHGDEVERILRRVGLWEVRKRRVGTYSKGMKQKLGLAQAVIGKAPLLLLDEPTNGLDPQGILDFYTTLKTLVQEEDRTVLLSSHLLAEIEDYVSHIAFLREGRILACGACAELVASAGLPSRIHLRYDRDREPDLEAHVTALRQHGWSVSIAGMAVEITLPGTDISHCIALLSEGPNWSHIDIARPGLRELYLQSFLLHRQLSGSNGKSRIQAAPTEKVERDSQ